MERGNCDQCFYWTKITDRRGICEFKGNRRSETAYNESCNGFQTPDAHTEMEMNLILLDDAEARWNQTFDVYQHKIAVNHVELNNIMPERLKTLAPIEAEIDELKRQIYSVD